MSTYAATCSGASSSSGGQLTIEDVTAGEPEPPAKNAKISQDSPGQIFLASLQQSMSHPSYRTVVTQADIVENIMREENGGVLFPLQEDVIRTLKEGNVQVLMLVTLARHVRENC